MFHKFTRLLLFLGASAAFVVSAQPCADTQPSIAGPQVVTNNQIGVLYSTPSIPGHTYSWTVVGGIITSGAGTSQITVTWGAVGAGSVSVQETNTALACSSTNNKVVAVQPLLVSYFYYTNTSCYGDSVCFHDMSVADPAIPIVSYEWNFGDGGTSTLQNPCHVFLPPFNVTYTIRLVITNQGGFKDTIYDAVAVYPNQFIPTADYTWILPNCGYDATTFNSTTSTTPPGTLPLHWKWDFDDPGSGLQNTSTLQNPSHIFTSPGSYDVMLIISNKQYCYDTLIQTVVVDPSIPTAKFAYSSPTCLNNPVFFTDQSISPVGKDITKWEWNFGDGSAHAIILFPGNPNVNHIFPGLGPYRIQLNVTNSSGCVDSTFKFVSLDPSPIANFSSAGQCLGDSTHFTDHSLTNNGPPLTAFRWDFGDPNSGYPTSTLQNPSHLFSNTGTFTVTLVTLNSSGCPDTIKQDIIIHPKPAVEYLWNIGSQNNQIIFHIDSLPTGVTNLAMIGPMVTWNFGDGTYATGTHNPVHTYAAAGSFDVTLTVTDTIGCSNFITHTVTVPSIPFAFFGTNSPVCFGQPICFTDLSSVPSPPFGFINQWVWNFGDGTPNDTIHFPNNPNVCHTYATIDTFLVTLTVWDNWGYQDSYSTNVIIKPNPIANFQYNSACDGQPVSFTDASFPNGGGSLFTWDWNFGDPASGINNTSGAQNPTHTFTTCGWYNVRLIVGNFNNCVDTVIKAVYVRCKPPVAYLYDTACYNQVTNFWADQTIMQIDSIVSWSWDFGDGTSIMHDPVTVSHLYTSLNTFTATLTVIDIHGCSNKVSHTIRVNPLPIPQFIWATPTCQNAFIQFTDQSYIPVGYPGYVARWEWNFGDGTPKVNIFLPNNPSIMHQFAGPSLNYPVTLKIWSGDSCIDSIQHIVNLTPAPVANFSFTSTPCSSQPVQFTDLSQLNGGGSIASWSWNFADPSSGVNNQSALQNPTHQFNASGSYLVRLVVTNVDGCTDTIWHTVDVNMLPVSDFSADTACLNMPTHFTSLAIPNSVPPVILIYDWDFGDGIHSPMQNPSHTYTTSGLYWVRLTVTNSNGCIKDTLKQILVNPLPLPAFTYTTPNCVGAQVCYHDMSTVPTGFLGYIQNWFWDFGDGTTANITFPSNPDTCHVFVGAALSHVVTLTVTTNTGCVKTVTQTVVSIPSPIANFNFPSFPTSPCAKQQVQFTDQSQPNGGGSIVTWQWNFGDPGSGSNNTSPAQNPIHIFSGSGNFTVTLIATNSSGCTDTIAKTVIVNSLPFADFSADIVCLGTSTTFTNQSTSVSPATIVQYLWDFGDGQSSTAPAPTNLYAAAGTFNVKLTVTTDGGCVKDTTKQVFVLPHPVASFSFTSPTCAGDSVHFNDLSTTAHGSIFSWFWNFGDGNTTTINFPGNPNVYHTYANGGPYTVTLTITTSDSCHDTYSQQVLIQAKPLANFDFSPTRCQNSPVSFTDLSQQNGGSPITTWNWNFGDPSSGSLNQSTVKNPTHTYSGFGTFQVTLTVYNGSGCHDTITKAVSVQQAPQASFTADTSCVDGVTHFTDASTANVGSVTSWLWDFGDPSSTTNTSTLQNPTHTYTNQGTYTVTLSVTNTGTCSDDTTMQVVVNPRPSAMFSYTAVCVGDSTQFTDLSIAPGSQVVTWLWNFGDGGTSTIQNPSHTFANQGTFNVSLTVWNLANCMDSIVIPVVARPTPVAAFTYQNYFCPAGKVDFQNQSHGVAAAIVDNLWIFEPGSQSTNINPTYIFPVTDTTYLVMLIVTDNYGCKDTIADSVYVKPGFKFDFLYDSACYLKPTHFTHLNQAQGDSLYNPYWEFGDPNSGQQNIAHTYNPTHTFTAPGIYTVKFRAYDSDNCVDSVYHTVVVWDIPATNFSWTSLPCDSVIHFADSSGAGSGSISNWYWIFGDGSISNLPNPPFTQGDTSHMYSTIGQFPVTLIITNSHGCIDSISKTVERFPCIKAGFLHGDTLLCARYLISFGDTSLPVDNTTIDQWHWTFGDGLDTIYTTRSNTITHKYANAGTYTVTLIIHATVNGKAFLDSVKQVLIIHPTPLTYFSGVPVCLNQISLFRDTSNTFGEGISRWNWNFGEPTSGVLDTSTFKNPSHKYGAAGTYDIKLVVMNRFGCQDSLTKSTRIFLLPEAHFTSDTICRNVPMVFIDKSLEGDTLINSWRWNFGVLNTKTDTAWVENPVYRYKNEGAYTVRMIVQDKNMCLDTLDSLVTVNPTPMAAFTITDNLEGMIGKIQLNNKSAGATIYFWNFGNGETSMDENPIVTYKNDGTYTIRLVTANDFNCYDTTYYKYEVLFKGLWVPNAFSPTNTNIAVRLFKPVGINIKQYHVMVFDSWGHLMWESTLLDSQGRPVEGWDGTFNGNLQPQGTYMYKINALFIDNSEWQGSDIGKGEAKTMGTVTLIR